MLTKTHRRSPDERGAALVEFALILPLFMALILGMFSGGIAYNQKITITNAVREGSRYGATLPVAPDMATWLRAIAIDVRDNATGDLEDGAGGRRICVAYVYPDGTKLLDRTSHVVVTTAAIPAVVTSVMGPCTLPNGATFTDGMPDDQRRVNVVASRSAKLEALIFSRALTLQGQSVTRFEAVQ